jgi:8-oxo-dGTP pyrophosphatase MutT (NUDIX family)
VTLKDVEAPYTAPVTAVAHDGLPEVQPPLPRAATVARLLAPVLARTPAVLMSGGTRRAGVLIALYDRDEMPCIVLTRRTATLPHHPDQVSLPGGRWDAGDMGLRFTALREAHEELGITPEAVTIVGRLDDVHARGSDHIIAPYVGVLSGPFVPQPNASEIARVIEVRLDDLLDADARLPPQADDDVMALRYPLLGEDVWGATARILRRFAHLTRRALVPA